MIRVVLFLAATCLIALGVSWLADRPGEVSIVWLGLQIDTSVMVAAVAVAVVAAAAIWLWSLLRFILGSPGRMATALKEHRRRKGYLAISRGLIAIGAGDARAARRFADEAQRIASGEPLALLLRAQTAQLHGDRAAAEEAFRAMAGRADTRLIGLRGLYVEAQRRADPAAARRYAEEAASAAPALPWAGQAVLDFRCAAGDWQGALEILEAHIRSGLVDRATYRRQRAVLLTARAIDAEERDRDRATTLAVEATTLAPDLVPAAALAGRLLADAGEPRKAGKILEAAWRRNPHPDLAETHAHLRLADSARDRLARVEALARQPVGHIEGALAVARAALDAREFATARAALAPLLAEPTQRVAMLMAELEDLEHGDEGRDREWMARALRAARDPAWTADGIVCDRWMPVSPVTGRLDAFQWKVPVEELAEQGPAIEHRASPAIEAEAQLPVHGEPTPRRDDLGVAEKSAGAAARVPGIASGPPGPRAAPIIPLIHAPDDPGPQPEPDPPPEADPRHNGWWRLGRLFR